MSSQVRGPFRRDAVCFSTGRLNRLCTCRRRVPHGSPGYPQALWTTGFVRCPRTRSVSHAVRDRTGPPGPGGHPGRPCRATSARSGTVSSSPACWHGCTRDSAPGEPDERRTVRQRFAHDAEPPFAMGEPWTGRPPIPASDGGGYGGALAATARPPQDNDAEQSVLGSMLLSKDAIADVIESVARRRLLPPGPRDDLRRDRRPLRPRRAGRPDHRVGRAAPSRRAGPGRRRAVPPHAVGERPDRRQRRLLRRDRAREGDPAPAGRRRHQDRADGVRRRGRGRRDRRPGPGRGLRRHREAAVGGLRAAERDHGGDARRDRGDQQPRRRDDRRADRLRRPRRAHQRPAPAAR